MVYSDVYHQGKELDLDTDINTMGIKGQHQY